MRTVYLASIKGTITPCHAKSTGRHFVQIEGEDEPFVREIPNSSRYCDTWEEARAWIVNYHGQRTAVAHAAFFEAERSWKSANALPEHEVFELETAHVVE